MTRFKTQAFPKQAFPKQAMALVAVILIVQLAASCGFKRKVYENPIAKDTQQPDKVLFDKAINDIEHGRYELARLTLNTLINTYDTSEYLAKAKLAIADSWYREGGAHGLGQAEAEYKDFILFYPTMEEAAESQEKICMIHYSQMEKADRDQDNTLRAEQECRQLMTQFPNSKFAPLAEQRLRDIQEVLAEAEMRTGHFYHRKGANAAAANRLGALVDQYPLYSRADEALWEEADSYSRMGPRFRQKTGEILARLMKEYPLSSYADQAKKKLESLEMPVPDADPQAAARMKYEAENHTKPKLVHRSLDFLHRAPDVSQAAKSGTPTMTNPKATIPALVPAPSGASGNTDVTVAPISGPSALDTNPDARSKPPGSSTAASSTETKTQAQEAPAAADSKAKKGTQADSKAKKKKKKNDKNDQNSQPAASAASAVLQTNPQPAVTP
jgi:outer membrane protein assembly factor BamD